MRKGIIMGLLVAICLLGAQDDFLEKVLANEKIQQVVEWVNTLGRQPEDPAYLTLNYRMRRIYFSLTAGSTKNPVVFFGDSITFGADWERLFPESPVVNRGISGDTTSGLLNRQNEIIALRPKQIFLMIGTNDLCFGRPVDQVIENYSKILARFQAELPGTPVYVQSILPFNDQMFPSNGLRKNQNIRALNKAIKPLAQKYGYEYLDLSGAFTGKDGRLLPQYTYDGLHLNDDAYQVWRRLIDSYVVKDVVRK
ncbi:MAG TPA: GDSL-type esterase/lipase family protein [Negativicutes bacterium]|nr:GDSL-type esterase/lipase family protein [Negativicutes bacterium]